MGEARRGPILLKATVSVNKRCGGCGAYGKTYLHWGTKA